MMYITRKHISRRTLLRGAGSVALALPFLDAMHPAMAAESNTAAAPIRRLGIVYYPHGVVYERWIPKGDSGPLELTEPLMPLQAHRDKINIITGLTSCPDRTKVDFHPRALASWLTGCEPTEGRVSVGISVDQVAAAKIGQETQFASLELAAEGRGGLSYRDATTQLPFERNPRLVFERLFGEGGKIDPEAAAARRAMDSSTLDAVTERINALKRRLGPSDIHKLDQYLESIRDIERRIQIASETPMPDLPEMARPAGAPSDWSEHVKLLMDLQVLAYQADLTRVGTMMIAGEASGMTFPHLGISMQHHEISHHNYDEAKIEAMHQVNIDQSKLFAYYLDKMEAVQEANGSLLDNSVMLFGSSLSNPTVHSQKHLSAMVAGGAAGRLKGGRFIRVPGDKPPWRFADDWEVKSPTPMANLHLTLLDLVGVPTDSLGDSNGRISL